MAEQHDSGPSDSMFDPQTELDREAMIAERQREIERFSDGEQKNVTYHGDPDIPSEEEVVFEQALEILNKTGVKYMVGAAFARHWYTGIWRTTKDLDVFVRPEDLKAVFRTFEAEGYTCHVEFGHWLAKAKKDPHFVDLIFGASHGYLRVDDSWFVNRKPAEIMGVSTWIMPIEEMLAQAMYVATRGRFDGAEVAHLILHAQGHLDWQRILALLGENRQLLLWHLVMFDLVYPGHPEYLPQEIMVQLFDEMRQRWEQPVENPMAFRGTLLDPFLFTVDVEDWGYEDRRRPQAIVNDEGELL